MSWTTALCLLSVVVYAATASLVCRRQESGIVGVCVFLRRAFHSSAVLNRWLYIDGGEFSYYDGEGIAYQYSTSLVSIDLTKDWTNTSVSLHSIPKPPGTPNLRHGGIWVDRARGVLYTGFSGTHSHFGDGAPSPQGLWSFTPDRSGKPSGSWKNLNESAHDSFTRQPRPFRGQVASGDGFGFLLAGFVGDGVSTQTHISSLAAYDLSSKGLRNFSDARALAPGWEQYGGTTFVPNWGRHGILISVGGYHGGGAENMVSFQTVLIYDIDSQRWFEQETSGDIPRPRKEFCIAGGVSNKRTHDILVYGGWDGRAGPDAVPYDSAFVLTLPGFHWVRADYPPRHPRHGHSCNGVGGGQILIVGGVDSAHLDPAKEVYRSVFDTPDPFTKGLAIFDLSKLAWSPSYSANRGLQKPAPQIQAYYDAHGRVPASGFSSRDLERLFAVDDFRKWDESTLTSGASHRGSHSVGAIIGPLVGVAVVVALAIVAGCWRHRPDSGGCRGRVICHELLRRLGRAVSRARSRRFLRVIYEERLHGLERESQNRTPQAWGGPEGIELGETDRRRVRFAPEV